MYHTPGDNYRNQYRNQSISPQELTYLLLFYYWETLGGKRLIELSSPLVLRVCAVDVERTKQKSFYSYELRMFIVTLLKRQKS